MKGLCRANVDSLMCCWVIASFSETPPASNLPPAECRRSLRHGIQEGEVERKLKCGWDSPEEKAAPRNVGGWDLNHQSPFVKGSKILDAPWEGLAFRADKF